MARRLYAAEVEAGDASMAERLQAEERKAAVRARRAEDAQRILCRPGCTRAGLIRAMLRRRGRQRLRRLLALLGVGGWLPLRCGAVDCVCVCVISADPSEQEESDASVAFVLLLVWFGDDALSRWGFPSPSMCTFARTWNINIAPSFSGEARWVSRVCAGVALVALI